MKNFPLTKRHLCSLRIVCAFKEQEMPCFVIHHAPPKLVPVQMHNKHAHTCTQRLTLILAKTKWYISSSSGQAWDVHQHVYLDYENFIHNITSNIILTKHSVPDGKTQQMLCRNTQGNELTSKNTTHTFRPFPPLSLHPGWPFDCLWLTSQWVVFKLTSPDHESTQVAVLRSNLCYVCHCFQHFHSLFPGMCKFLHEKVFEWIDMIIT